MNYEQKELLNQANAILNRLAQSFGKQETDLAYERKTDTMDYFFSIKRRITVDNAQQLLENL
jgi:hypothetical protein